MMGSSKGDGTGVGGCDGTAAGGCCEFLSFSQALYNLLCAQHMNAHGSDLPLWLSTIFQLEHLVAF